MYLCVYLSKFMVLYSFPDIWYIPLLTYECTRLFYISTWARIYIWFKYVLYMIYIYMYVCIYIYDYFSEFLKYLIAIL